MNCIRPSFMILATALVLLSCKKDKVKKLQESPCLLTSVQVNNSPLVSAEYDASGRLSAIHSLLFGNEETLWKMLTYTSGEVLLKTISRSIQDGTTDTTRTTYKIGTNGFPMHIIEVDGVADTTWLEHNSKGQLTRINGQGDTHIFYENDNHSRSISYDEEGVLTDSTVYEYTGLERPDNFIFEEDFGFTSLDEIRLGRADKNLPRKITSYSLEDGISTVEFSYTFSGGNVTRVVSNTTAPYFTGALIYTFSYSCP